MSREIKFRAWDSSLKFMVDPAFYEIAMDGRHIHFENDGDWINHTEKLRIMQYTGLKDKHGKEIYEGDIISFTRPVGNWTGRTMASVYEVYFEEHICAFVLKSVGGYTKFRNARNYEYEILGNIYENQELLDNVSDKIHQEQ